MEEWKFLLQKDGDRSWLPLDSPDVEILEGRYRLVARSSQVNTDIGIRVCHLATAEDPPKRRIHKRSSRTNENGLMVVLPFTHLQPGIWELSCFSTDPMSDLMGDTLHHAVCLRVAAPIAEGDLDDWNDSPYAPEHHQFLASAQPSEESGESMPTEQDPESLLRSTDQEPQLLARSYPTPIPSEVEAPSLVPQSEPLPALNALTLRLQLQNSALTGSRGQMFALSGQVVVDDLAQLETEIPASWLQSGDYELLTSPTSSEVEPDLVVPPPPLAGVVAQELQLCLRDPQSSTIILRQQQPLPGGIPPLDFKFIISLPHTLATHLLLGEVVLYGTRPGSEEPAIAVQVAPFTVTVDPENLVEELKKVHAALNTAMLEEQSRGEELADLAVQFAAKLRREKLRSTLDLSFLDLTAPTPGLEGLPSPQPASPPAEEVPSPATERPLATVGTTQPRAKQILPPQLYTPVERPAGKKHLELPMFNRPITSAPPVPPQEAALIDDLFTAALEPLEDAISFKVEEEADLDEVTTEAVVLQPVAVPEPVESSDLADAVEPPQVTSSPIPPNAEEEASLPVRLEFQSLKLQQRFLDRLNRLAGDHALAATLKSTVRPGQVEAGVTAPVADPETISESPAYTELGAMAKEVVVEDDPSWRDQVLRAPSLRSRADAAPTKVLALPEDTPIPVPLVEVLTDEIIAGIPCRLRVKLPDHLPPTCVKLWVSDRQTRSILDGPRWLMDLSPNGLDEVTTDLEITVPEGSLEIRIEAISVELQTQRESQKISLERTVSLPDLPDLWDDDLGKF